MCSISCRDSKSKTCKCECGGLYHGIYHASSLSAFTSHLNQIFPPCTPVRFKRETLRGSKEGRVQRFFTRGEIVASLTLQTGEVVRIDQISAIGEKTHENSVRTEKKHD